MVKPILVSKITFTFPERFYEKYDIFEVEGIEYFCISRPRKLDLGEWCIDVFPLKKERTIHDPLESIWKSNTMSEFFQ